MDLIGNVSKDYFVRILYMPLADTSNAQIELGLINGSWNYSNLRWEGTNTINDVSFNYGGNGNPTCESIYSVISSFPLITSNSQNIIEE